MDAALKRAEAQPLTLEVKAGLQLGERDEVVVARGEPTRLSNRRLTELQVGVDRSHATTVSQA